MKYFIAIVSILFIAIGILLYAQQPQDQHEPHFNEQTRQATLTEAEKKTTSMRSSRDIEPQAHTESFVATEDIPTPDESTALENFPVESDEELVKNLK